MEKIDILITTKSDLEAEVNKGNKALDKLRGTLINTQKQFVGLTKTKNTVDQLRDSIAKTKVRIAEKNRALQKSKKEYSLVNKQLNDFNKNLIDTGQHLTPVERFLNQGFRDARQPLLQFNGDLLSLMFLGMSMQGVFQGALSAIFNGYKDVIPENSKFNREMTKLTANWEFFKFQLADAFVQSKVFDVLINGANSLLTSFQSLSPQMQQFIVLGLGIGTVFAFILTWVSLIGLGIASWINLFKGAKAPIDEILTKFTQIKDFIKSMGTMEFWKGLMAALKTGTIDTWFKVTQWAVNLVKIIGEWFKRLFSKDVLNAVWDLVSGIVKGVSGGLLKVFKAITTFFKLGPLGWIYVGIQSLFEGIQEVGDRTFSNGFIKAIAVIVNIIINLIENIVQFIAEFIDVIINTIAWLIEGAAGILGFDIDIPKLELGNMIDSIGDKASEWALDMMAEKRAEREEKPQNTTNVIIAQNNDDALEMAGVGMSKNEFFAMNGI